MATAVNGFAIRGRNLAAQRRDLERLPTIGAHRAIGFGNDLTPGGQEQVHILFVARFNFDLELVGTTGWQHERMVIGRRDVLINLLADGSTTRVRFS